MYTCSACKSRQEELCNGQSPDLALGTLIVDHNERGENVYSSLVHTVIKAQRLDILAYYREGRRPNVRRT
jgi:hypothetical protein